MKLTLHAPGRTLRQLDVPAMELAILALNEAADRIPGLPFTLRQEEQAIAELVRLLPHTRYAVLMEDNVISVATTEQSVLNNIATFDDAYQQMERFLHKLMGGTYPQRLSLCYGNQPILSYNLSALSAPNFNPLTDGVLDVRAFT